MKTQEAFWDQLAAKYARAPVRNADAYQKKLQITRDYLQPAWELLEFGCGTGSTALVHAPHVGHITAIDISGNMVDIARRKATEAGTDNVSFERSSLEGFAGGKVYDAVLGLNILHLMPELPQQLQRVAALLKPGGLFISSTGCLKGANPLWRVLIPIMQLFNKAPYVNMLSGSELRAALGEAGFAIEQEWQPGKNEPLFIVARKSMA